METNGYTLKEAIDTAQGNASTDWGDSTTGQPWFVTTLTTGFEVVHAGALHRAGQVVVVVFADGSVKNRAGFTSP